MCFDICWSVCHFVCWSLFVGLLTVVISALERLVFAVKGVVFSVRAMMVLIVEVINFFRFVIVAWVGIFDLPVVVAFDEADAEFFEALYFLELSLPYDGICLLLIALYYFPVRGSIHFAFAFKLNLQVV